MHTASNKRDANANKTGTNAQLDAHGIKQTRCQRHQNWDQCPTRCTRHQTNAMHTASKLGPMPNAMHTASNKRDAHGIKTGTNAQRDAHGIKQTRCSRHQNWDQCPTRCTQHHKNAMHAASKQGPMPNAMHTASDKRDAHGIKLTHLATKYVGQTMPTTMHKQNKLSPVTRYKGSHVPRYIGTWANI